MSECAHPCTHSPLLLTNSVETLHIRRMNVCIPLRDQPFVSNRITYNIIYGNGTMYFGYNMRGVSRHFRKEEPTLRNGQQKNIRREGSVRAAVEVARWLWMGGVVVRVRVVRA